MTEKELNSLFERDLLVWNEGDLSILDEILSPDFVRHEMDVEGKENIVGIEANKENVKFNRTAFPDFHVTADDAIIKDDTLVMRWTLTGTHLGQFGDVPPTGKKIKMHGASIGKIKNGKFAEEWVYYNQVAGFAQMGFTFTPPKREAEPQF